MSRLIKVSVRIPGGAVARDIDPAELRAWRDQHPYVAVVDTVGHVGAAPRFEIVVRDASGADE